MALNDFFKLTVIYRNQTTGNILNNVLCFQQKTILVFDEPGPDLVDRFRTQCQTALRACMSDTLRVDGYRVSEALSGGVIYEEPITTSNVGTLTGDAIPYQTGGIITLRTGLPGRSYRGRIFLPPANEAQNSQQGVPVSGYLGIMGTFGTALLNMDTPNVNWANWGLSVWSSKLNTGTNVNSVFPRPYWAIQRKRRNIVF